MNRIDRLLGILTLLQTKKYVTAEAIASKFQISVRTVYRDIKALGEQGVPVSFEQHKGYFVVQGYFLPPVSFTSEEANALLLMENLTKRFADKSIETHYSSALNKVKSVLRGSQKESLELLTNTIFLQAPAAFNPDFAYLSTLQKAISGRETLEIDYKNQAEEVSTRLIEPIGLIFYAFNWHLIGWCYKREEYRDFRVSRMQQVKLTGQPFRKNDHIEVGEYMKLLPVNY
ncbi:helix-turn-helix transcriptional regulator [Tellurirhabdus bombi]|uniref:helix-turn-helix transcriptional regulator n=1 Tax=Tellurirhabdus bombi TaxID=2907205 RepID=UPI001F46AD1B|nr:YafY family protein [Tellurirhabdus bombi]